MHTGEIAEHIFEEFHVRINKWSLGTQLWRHIKRHHDSPFYKSPRARNAPLPSSLIGNGNPNRLIPLRVFLQGLATRLCVRKNLRHAPSSGIQLTS